MEHPDGAHCHICNKTIGGLRYKCIECDDFDLCQSCESDYHSGHVIIRFTHPPIDNEFLKFIEDRRPRDKPFLIQGIHDDDRCHSCRGHVNGFLYKCCDCTYSVCRRCQKDDHVCITGNPHLFFRFADPLSLNSFNKRFWLEILQIRSIMCNRKLNADFQTVLPCVSFVHDAIKCNVCDNDVVGLRFNCIDCQEYNLCSSCEPKNVHSGHLLVRVGKVIRSKEKRIFTKAVRLRLLSNDQRLTRAQRSDLNIWNLIYICNICGSSIRGYHYKCLECNCDLCSFCQMKEWHVEHLMVRFIEPLNQNPANQKLYEEISERASSPASLTFKGGEMIEPNRSTGFLMTAIQRLCEAIIERGMSTGFPMSPNPAFNGPNMSPIYPMQELSPEMRTANVMVKNGGNAMVTKRFPSFVDTINTNDQIAHGRRTSICMLCHQKTSQIMLVHCGYLSICSSCYGAYMGSSR